MNLTKAVGGTATALLALLAFGSPSHAADIGTSTTVPTARQTEVDVGLDVGYDSNAARSDEALAARRGLKLGDEITTPSVDVAVARPIGRAILFIKADSAYDIHAVNKKRDQINYDVNGGGAGHFGPCQETLTGDYVSDQTDLAELDNLTINNTRTTKDAKFSADCGRTTGLAPQISASNTWINNSAANLQLIDSQTVTVDAALAYRRPVLGSVSIFGEYAQATYPPHAILGAPAGDTTAFGYYIYAGGVKYERHEGRIDAILSVSYTRLDPYSSVIQKFRGLTYSLDATYSLTSRLKVHASGVRATVPSNRVFADFRLDETYATDVSYSLSSRLTMKLSAEYLNSNYSVSSNYQNEILNGGFIGLTSETVYTTLASVTYDLSKRIEITLAAGDVERIANDNQSGANALTASFHDLSYSSTTVTLGVKAKF